MKAAAAHEVRAIRPREDDLEDIFLRYYRPSASGVSWPTLEMTLRLRLPCRPLSAAFGLIAVLLAVGALFPAVGHTIGKLSIPKGVADLLGGADYGTITGWYRSEIALDLRPARDRARSRSPAPRPPPPARRRTGSSRWCSPTRSSARA